MTRWTIVIMARFPLQNLAYLDAWLIFCFVFEKFSVDFFLVLLGSFYLRWRSQKMKKIKGNSCILRRQQINSLSIKWKLYVTSAQLCRLNFVVGCRLGRETTFSAIIYCKIMRSEENVLKKQQIEENTIWRMKSNNWIDLHERNYAVFDH